MKKPDPRAVFWALVLLGCLVMVVLGLTGCQANAEARRGFSIGFLTLDIYGHEVAEGSQPTVTGTYETRSPHGQTRYEVRSISEAGRPGWTTPRCDARVTPKR